MLATGLAKAFGATGPARILDAADPLFGIRFRHLLLLVGLLELLVAWWCFSAPRRTFTMAAVAALATNFLLYRVGLWALGWKQPCHCMGTLTDALHMAPPTADHIMKGLLAYLLVASYLGLRGRWRK